MHLSVEASLKKLRTSYIDILYVHWWDFETTVEEVMDGLHNLITSGKVLYLGISDSPAYVVADANRYAQAGFARLLYYQSLTSRSHSGGPPSPSTRDNGASSIAPLSATSSPWPATMEWHFCHLVCLAVED